jgi:16S rRNA (cytidine1402-2'-O)-methyltransferase
LSGTLFIVSTPIGNLGDISPRVKHALSESTVVLAEDTRVSVKLLHHLGLKTPLLSCHEFNEGRRADLLQEHASAGNSVALVSDAGTPLVSDPGYQIVRKAIELGMQVIPIPGPSAALAALVGSGLPSDRFAFEGFLPDKAGDRDKRLRKLANDDRTLIFFAPPHGIAMVLSSLLEYFGDRDACLARELTKKFEEFIRGSLSKLHRHVETEPVRGEYVIVVAGASADSAQSKTDESDVRDRLRVLLDSGARLKDACSLLAKETGWASSDIYKIGLSLKDSGEST